MLWTPAQALPVPAADYLLFQVVRHGSVMGEHRLDFVGSPGGLAVKIAVRMALYLGPIPLFRYEHRALEVWHGDQCVTLTSHTNHNGTELQLTATRDAAGWRVIGSKGDLRAPPDALPATHWNRRMLQGPMINTETGAIMRPRIIDLGFGEVPAFQAPPIRAEHFELSGDAQMDTWYNAAGWTGAAFKGGDGSEIHYERG